MAGHLARRRDRRGERQGVLRRPGARQQQAKDEKAGEGRTKAANSAKSDEGKAAKASKADSKADKKSDAKAADKGAAKNSSSSNQKVTLCHRTNSDHNPYVRITVSINSVIKSSGHDGHNGPVYAAGMKAAHQKWGDIIPAFSYDGGSYAGQNWAAGAAIFGAGCAVPTGGGHTTPPTTITVTATPSGGRRHLPEGDAVPPHQLRPQPLRADHGQHQQRDQELGATTATTARSTRPG